QGLMKPKSHGTVVPEARYRHPQLIDFLTHVARAAGASNIDHYFRSGTITDIEKLTELSAHFLFIAMGFGSDEFIPLVGNKEAPAFVPQSEGYYPWAFYSVPTVHEDLMEVFHKRAMQYLHSDAAGRKTHVVITNFRALIVCDLRRYLPEYDLAL